MTFIINYNQVQYSCSQSQSGYSHYVNVHLVLLFSFPACHSCCHLKHCKVNMDFLDILLAARMADSGAHSARHSSVLV